MVLDGRRRRREFVSSTVGKMGVERRGNLKCRVSIMLSVTKRLEGADLGN